MNKTAYEFIRQATLDKQFYNILEVGSRQIGSDSNENLRNLFPNALYLGVDVVEGDGVDLVYKENSPLPIRNDKYDLIICTEVLEHAENPAYLIKQMASCLSERGIILITTPFLFEIHNYPDYWRLTPLCISRLFKRSNLNYSIYWVGGTSKRPSALAAIASRDKSILNLNFRAREGDIITLLKELVNSILNNPRLIHFSITNNGTWKKIE